MAVIRIPDDLLERVLRQLKDRRKRLGHRIHSSQAKGRTEGSIQADRRKLQDLDEFTAILETRGREE